MKIAFVVPDGVGVKNYLFSKFFEKLVHDKHEIIIIHNLSQSFEDMFGKLYPQVYFFSINPSPESFLVRLLREALCYGRLKLNAIKKQNPTILLNWQKFHRISLKKKLLYRSAEFFAALFLRSFEHIVFWENIYFKLFKTSNSTKVWKNWMYANKPDCVFVTHQRPPESLPIVEAAKLAGIRTIAAIFSWDNLPKARLTVKANEFVVWSPYMKQEFLEYYPEIDSKQIKVLGSPQFEYYDDVSFQMTRLDFANHNGLDISKKWICFSGDDVLTSPFDPNYLMDLCKVIQDRSDGNKYQILVRPAPADTSNRFLPIAEAYPFVKIANLTWFKAAEKDNWIKRFPLKEDIILLTSTVLHCEAVVNVGSTMALDFFNLKKPAFYINYNSVESNFWSIETIYQFQHFRSMDGLSPVNWINSKEGWSQMISDLSDGKELYYPDSAKWLERLNVYKAYGGAKNFVVKLFTEI